MYTITVFRVVKMISLKATEIRIIQAGVFKRFVAFCIDTLLLGLFGLLLSIPLGNLFFRLGQHGWWIGLLISLVYFSLCETSLFRGQTLGYKLLGLSVIQTKGNYLSIWLSTVRNLLILLVVFSNSIGSLVSISNIFINGILGTIFFSYIFTFFVFILFHPQHRGIQDLASQAIVVKKKEYESLTGKDKKHYLTQPVNNKKAIIISAIVTVILIISGIIITIIEPFKGPFWDNLLAIQNVISKDQGVYDASVNLNTFTDTTGSSTKSLILSVQVDRNIFLDSNKLNLLDRKIKKQAVNLYSQVDQINQVQVVFNSGYTIGIWTFNEKYSRGSSSPQSIRETK